MTDEPGAPASGVEEVRAPGVPVAPPMIPAIGVTGSPDGVSAPVETHAPAGEPGTDRTVERDDVAPGEVAPGDVPPVDDPAQHWRRLSPRMLAVHPIQELRRAIPALVALIFLGRNDRSGLWPLIGLALVVALGLSRWLTTTYRVTPTQIQVRRGLLRRSVLSVPRDRVRSVDITSHLMHRLLGLGRLTIGTGQSDRKKEDGLRLDALTMAAAERLRTELLHQRGPAGVDATRPGAASAITEPPEERLIAALRPSWVRYAPFTLSGLVTIGVVLGFAANFANQARVDLTTVGPVESARHALSSMSIYAAVLVVLLGIAVLVAVLSMGGYILAFWGFRLSRQGATLHVARGLLTTRATTIEERRLRGAEISEPLLLRWVGGARCVAITTGLRVGRGAERGGSVLMPAAPASAVDAAAGNVLTTSAPVTVALVRHGGRARWRRFSRALAVAAIITGIATLLWWGASWPSWVPLGALALFPLGALLAVDRYRNLGHALVDGFLVSRQGSIIRRRYMLSCEGVIGWNEHQSFFQRRAGLVTLTATTAAGRQGYQVLDVSQSEAVALARQAIPGLLDPFLTEAAG